MHKSGLLAAAFGMLPVSGALAHPGGLNAEGCHNNRRQVSITVTLVLACELIGPRNRHVPK
jgi:hypothetical protein